MNGKARPPLWVLSMALFPLGLGGLILGGLDVRQGLASERWMVVEGTVLSSKLAPQFLGADQSEVRYSFEFNGAGYVSGRIWPGNWINSLPLLRQSDAAEIARRFPEGARVPVSIDPSNPSRSAILPGARRATRWTAVFTVFLLLGIASPFAVDRWTRGSYGS